MCTTTKPVAPQNILYKGVIYKGVTMRKPTLGDDSQYWENYKAHLFSLPSEKDNNNIPMDGYVFKTIK